MKKKIMRMIFILIFIVGIVVGYLLPGDVKSLSKVPLQEDVFDVPKKLGQLDLETNFFKYTVLAATETGSIELLRLEGKIPLHMHPKENHFVYIYKGKARAVVGDLDTEVWPGQIIAIPAGVLHQVERVGDTPVEIILFSTPPFMPGDTVFLEE